MPLTFALRRFDEAKLKDALAALAKARAEGSAEPLFPWLESWRIDGLLGEDRPQAPDDFRALLEKCAVGRGVDLFDRAPARLAGGAADRDLLDALSAMERGSGLEEWMREPPSECAPDGVLGILSRDEVARLAPRVGALDASVVLSESCEDFATYARAWDEVRRAFAVAAERGEGIALHYHA